MPGTAHSGKGLMIMRILKNSESKREREREKAKKDDTESEHSRATGQIGSLGRRGKVDKTENRERDAINETRWSDMLSVPKRGTIH